MNFTSRLRARGFTLIELIVVIAIIVLLVALVVPIVTSLRTGKSIDEARNAFDGYLSGLRMRASNRNVGMLLVLFPPEFDTASKSENREIKYVFNALDADGRETPVQVSPSFVAFEVDPSIQRSVANTKAVHRLRYLGYNLDYATGFDSDVVIHPFVAAGWKGNGSRLANQVPELNEADMTGLRRNDGDSPSLKGELERLGFDVDDWEKNRPRNVGIPMNTFMLYITPEGRALIPRDVPGFVQDGSPAGLEGDLVMIDGTDLDDRVLFLDFNALLRVRARIVDNEVLEGTRNGYKISEAIKATRK